jgi:hypothetical protein
MVEADPGLAGRVHSAIRLRRQADSLRLDTQRDIGGPLVREVQTTAIYVWLMFVNFLVLTNEVDQIAKIPVEVTLK